MPKVVDREQRRREIVEAYARVVARDGMAAASTRALAAELGVAAGALWHYFTGLEEVLEEALRLIFERSNMRIAEAREGRRGIEALHAILTQVLPHSGESIVESFVVVSFWGRARADFDPVSYEAEQDRLRRLIVELLEEAIDDGVLREEVPSREVADTILSFATSMQVELVLGTKLGKDSARQLRLVDSCLEPWRR